MQSWKTWLFSLVKVFKDSDFQVSYEHLNIASHDIVVMNSKSGLGMRGKRGGYTAMLIHGGFGPERLLANEQYVNVVKDFISNGKPVMASCHAGQLLIRYAAAPSPPGPRHALF